MRRNASFAVLINLPEELVARVQAYAAQNRTNVSASVREYLEANTKPEREISNKDPLLAVIEGIAFTASGGKSH